MARATVVPTAARSTSKATLDRTRPKNVISVSRPTGTSYARSGSVSAFGASPADEVGAAGVAGRVVDRDLTDGRASWRCSTSAVGGPRSTSPGEVGPDGREP